MTWWAWALLGWAVGIVVVGLLVGTTARLTSEIKWTQPSLVRRRRAPQPAVDETTAA